MLLLTSADIQRMYPLKSFVLPSCQKMMDEMKLTPNVVEATSRDGVSQNLEVLQKELTLCEKALAEYLETKRLAFPRFYFVSSADLLDVLSNGNQPKTVAR